MASINIHSETQSDSGWTYLVQVNDKGQDYEYRVTLSPSDYEQWSQGSVSPEKLVKKAFEFLLEREPVSSIMSEFDCSVIRRYFPEVDRELPKMLSA